MTPSAAITATRPTVTTLAAPPATLEIGGQAFEFPPGRLVLSHGGDQIDAVLCTDDPPAAIRPGYRGNSFMIEMKLGIVDPAELSSAVWVFKRPDRSLTDFTNGIFLDGTRRQFQPDTVTVTFVTPPRSANAAPTASVPPAIALADIRGDFLESDSSEAPGVNRVIAVRGRVPVVVNGPRSP